MGTPIESSSLVFTTREFYLSGSTDSAKGSTLTFEDLDNTLIFLSQSISEKGTGGSSIYSSSFSGSGALTIDTVGGISENTSVDNLEGKNFSELFDEIFFPTISPAGTDGTFSSVTNAGSTREIGEEINVTITSTFTRGTWSVPAQADRNYLGLPTTYYYTSGSTTEDNPSPSLTDNWTWPPHKVTFGANNFPTAVSYSAGDVPVNSKGVELPGLQQPAGFKTDLIVSFTGIYPYFYGSSSAATLSVADVVSAIQSLYGNSPSTSTQKVVATSTGPIIGYFYQPGSTPLWSWFAHPSTSTTKAVFYQNVSNTNTIGPAGTFNNNGTSNISATGYWNNISYRIYITNAKTAFPDAPAFTVELRN